MAKSEVATPPTVAVQVGDYVKFKPSSLQQYDVGHGEAVGVVIWRQDTDGEAMCRVAYVNRSGLYGVDTRPSSELVFVL